MLYFTIIYKAGVFGLEGGWLQAFPKGMSIPAPIEPPEMGKDI